MFLLWFFFLLCLFCFILQIFFQLLDDFVKGEGFFDLLLEEAVDLVYLGYRIVEPDDSCPPYMRR